MLLYSEKLLSTSKKDEVLDSFDFTGTFNYGHATYEFAVYPPLTESGKKAKFQTQSYTLSQALDPGYLYRFTVLDDGFSALANRGIACTEYTIFSVWANIFPIYDDNGNTINLIKKGNIAYFRPSYEIDIITIYRLWNSATDDKATVKLKIDKLKADAVKPKKYFWYKATTSGTVGFLAKWTNSETSPGSDYTRDCSGDRY